MTEPPPEKGGAAPGQRGHQTSNFSELQLPKSIWFGKRDIWLERYIAYLTREHERLGGGAIGLHYLGCIAASYREFQSAGTQESRFSAWLGVRTLCQWLSQLRREQRERGL